MEFFPPGFKVSVMKHSRLYLGGALLLTLLSLAAFAFPGPNLGIDFTGGTELQVRFRADVEPAEIRQSLEELGYAGPDVVAVQGHPREFILRVQQITVLPEGFAERARDALTQAVSDVTIQSVAVSPGGDKVTIRTSGEIGDGANQITTALERVGVDVSVVDLVSQGDRGARYEARLAGVADHLIEQLNERLGERGPESPLRVEWVGARAGRQLRDAAIQAMLYSLALIMVYIAFRFDLRFAPAAVIGLIHAVIVAAGIYVALGLEVNLIFVAAMLTVIGYGINDTVVVFDRIRENMGRMRGKSLAEIIDQSVSQNFSRTIMTGGSVMLSLIAFFVWGTSAIRDMSVALLIGIVTTTYTSVLVAAPLTEWIDARFFRGMRKQQARGRAVGRA